MASGLYRYLPPAFLREEVQPALQGLLSQELGDQVSLQFEKMTTEETIPYLEKLPPQGLFLVLGIPPVEERAFVEIDTSFGLAMIDRLLGGGGEVPAFLRSLTEIEEGVLSYLVLKLLARFHERSDRTPGSHFRLYEIRSLSEELASLVKPGSSSLVVMIGMAMGDRTGYARFILPAPFVQKAFSEPAKEFAESDHRYYENRLESLGFIKTDLWAEVGRSTVKANELEALHPGDVMLLEETSAGFHEGKIQGRLMLRAGSGGGQGYLCEVVDSGEKLQVRI